MKCTICNKPIVEGQARYTARDSYEEDTSEHYDCAFPDGQKTTKELLADLDKMQAKAKKLMTDIDKLSPKQRAKLEYELQLDKLRK